MRILQLLSIGLFTLLVASKDDGQSQDDVLNNVHGATPCEMQQITNVYFNLWSACAYTKTPADPPYPSCDSFQQNCTQALINVTTIQQSNTSYPEWAFMQLPANGTFDIVAAIASASGSPSHKWTTIQIVLPILVGVAVAVLLLLLGILIHRRRNNANRQRPWMQTNGNRPRFRFPALSSRQKVREMNRSGSWSIDEREEDLQEYQFVSYPASLQGSHASGHVRLSSSSSVNPPPLKIPEKRPPVQTLPGKSIWKRPLLSVRQLSNSIPRPWRSRVGVKNIPGYAQFRVDADDSDSPLSNRHTESLLGHARRSRSNLHEETIFEREPEDDSDEEALPFIPQEHSRSNHDAEPPPNAVLLISSTSARGSPAESNSAQQTLRQVPPASAPPRIPLPLLPPVSTKPPQPAPPVAASTSSQQPVRSQEPPPPPPAPASVGRSQVTSAHPPTCTTSPPPPRPTSTRRSPRSLHSVLPAQFANPPPLPSPPLLSSPPTNNLPSNSVPPPPQPRRRSGSDGGSSIRSLPLTPTPPYVRATPAPIRVLEPEPTEDGPPHSAPPYTPSEPPKSPPANSTRFQRAGSEAARSLRRLPLPPQ
ncbi:hypothetical protein B0H12DRAFT_1145607 [Mycena haematopus]|nr:hypothetical protein B0H12DRAFT_1145607 [Mycena haematopus]